MIIPTIQLPLRHLRVIKVACKILQVWCSKNLDI